MKHRFTSDEILLFITALDRHLPSEISFLMIGSAIGALQYKTVITTMDIDTISLTDDITESWNEAQLETGLPIKLDKVEGCTYEAPWEFMSRVIPLENPDLSLKRLRLFMPEKHDWALMKMTRSARKDLECLTQAADAAKFSPEIFLDRFKNEMGHVCMDIRVLVSYFAMLMLELFGETVRENILKDLKADRRWAWTFIKDAKPPS